MQNVFDEAKTRRLRIMEQLPPRQRLSSAERRIKIQQNIDEFHRTMQAGFYQPSSNHNSQEKRNRTHSQFYNKNSQISNSPSVKDLPSNNDHLQTARFQTAQNSKPYQEQNQQESKKQQAFGQESRVNDCDLRDRKEDQSQIVSEKIPKPDELKEDRNASFNFSDSSGLRNQLHQLNEESQRSKGGNVPIQVSQTSNNSSAIFFTSEFQQYISKAHETIQNQTIQQDEGQKYKKQQLRSIKEQPQIAVPKGQATNEPHKQGVQDYEKPNNYDEIAMDNSSRPFRLLNESKSGRSFAVSNDQSLKYSMNESAVHQLIHKKLGAQLFFDAQNFFDIHEKLAKMATKVLRNQVLEHFKSFRIFAKIYNLHTFYERILKRIGFEELHVHQEYIFETTKNDIKADKLCKKLRQKLINGCYLQWKHQSSYNAEKAQAHLEERTKALLNNSFRVLKMYWYDRKIQSQIDNYYLSKIFHHFKVAVRKESKSSNRKAIKFYYRNALRRYFDLFVEGIDNTRFEREKVELAYQHYSQTLLTKNFALWKEASTSRGGKYINLALTTKDVFKETNDHRWIQTKTMDFKQIK